MVYRAGWLLRAGVAALALTVFAQPAQAFFGGGGGGGDCESAVDEDDAEDWAAELAGIVDPLGTLASNFVDPSGVLGSLFNVSGLLGGSLDGLVGGIAGGLLGGGSSGCASEATALLTNIQQTYAVMQQAKMMLKTELALDQEVRLAMGWVNDLLRLSSEVLYEVNPALAKQLEIFKDSWETIDAQAVMANREAQRVYAREAGKVALVVSAGIEQDNARLMEELERIEKASALVEGQTQAIQVQTQLDLVKAKIELNNQRLANARGRQEGAMRDAQVAAEEMGRAYKEHLWRNVPDWPSS